MYSEGSIGVSLCILFLTLVNAVFAVTAFHSAVVGGTVCSWFGAKKNLAGQTKQHPAFLL